MRALAESRAPKALDGLRVRAALRAADGDLVVAARALRMSTRDVLQILLCAPPQEKAPLQSGTRRRYESDDADRPAWTDDDDAWGDLDG